MSEKNSGEAPIVVYGMANIGCDQRESTFQTLVQVPTAAATESKAEKDAKKVKPKGTGTGRPKRAGTPISKAFRYDGEAVRLSLLCQALKALGWIAQETDTQLFVDLFSGGEAVRQRVIWTGGVNTLAELFRRLVNERRLVTLPTGLSLWVMVNARFWEKERRQEFGTDRLRNTHAPKGGEMTIAYLVNILDVQFTMDEVRQMLENQR